jgi:hypothetical protein
MLLMLVVLVQDFSKTRTLETNGLADGATDESDWSMT